MKFNIICDRPGRLRVRSGRYAFTKEQGYGLEELLCGIEGVSSVCANSANGGVLVLYDNNARDCILDMLKGLSFSDIPEAKPSESQEMAEDNRKFYAQIARMAAFHFARKWFLPLELRTAWTFLTSLKFFAKGINALLSGHLNVDVLDASSIACAFLQGDPSTASSIKLLLNISEALEEHTRKQTVKALEGSLAFQIEQVWLVTEGEDVKVPLKSVMPGDKVRVQQGAMVPVDGTVISGEAMVNESSLTGESNAVLRREGHSVYAGTVIESGSVVIDVTKKSDETRVHDIASMIDESEDLKAQVQSKAEHLADSIVPFSFAVAGGTLLLTQDTVKAMSALMVDYSCALKLSIPIAVIAAMREATDRRILVKGGCYLEDYSSADTIVFDKTGTLTSANPRVAKVCALPGYDEKIMLRDAACIEEHFPHSVARAIVNKAAEEGLNHDEQHSVVEYVVAHGLSTMLDGDNVKIGSAHYIFEDEGIEYTPEIEQLEKNELQGMTIIYMAMDGKVTCLFGIEDPPRDDAAGVVDSLRKCGFDHVIMLTGDGPEAARRVAESIGVTEYRSQMLPEGKAEYIKQLKEDGHKVVMVGDGINDSPALAAADVSIAMRDASDLAKQVADITLLSEQLSDLLVLKELSSRLMKRTDNNYRFIIGFNTFLMAMGITGIMTPASTSLLHNLSTMALSVFSTTNYLDEDL